MQVTVERRPGSKVALTITVEPEVVEQRVEQLFQKHAKRVVIPGFRPGKAPRKMIEERLNRAALLQDAIEDVIDTTYKQALREQEIEPLERGDIEDLNTAEDMTVTYTAVVTVRPQITLADYTGLDITYTPTPVSDEQVESEIERLRERSSDFLEITDEGIQTGDYVTIDYTMQVNGEPYPEGDTTGYPLEVGSDTFFPELNDGLIGMKQGETKTLSTTYPEDYSNADLAGKTAEFEVTVQQVRRMVKPEANDEWAQRISQGTIQTLDDLKARLKENLQAVAAQADHDQVRGEIVRRIVDNSELELPETLVEEEYAHLMETLEHRLSHEHMSLEQYAEMINSNVEAIQQERRLLARDLVRRSLVLQEIARREGISVTEQDLNMVLASSIRDGRNVSQVRKELEKSGELDHVVSQIFHEKVLSFLESRATVVAEGQETAPAAEDTAPEATTEAAASQEDTTE